MKYVLKHVHTGEYVECLLGGARIFRLCHDLKVAAKFSDLPGVIRFVAGHCEKIEDFTIVGADQAAWQECSPFHHPSDCE